MHPGIKPEYVREINHTESFQFQCHSGVSCFNECCRMLDLALTPYDVLRLKNNLGLTADAFLEQYALIETDDSLPLPQVYLGMVDDGRGSCPFVTEKGCSVYKDRPGACRTYPLARGAFKGADGTRHEIFGLLTEPHCKGFDENRQQSIAKWMESQELALYNAYNDEVMAVMYHEKIQAGMKPNREQIEKFLLGLYRLDAFKSQLFNSDIELPVPLSSEMKDKIGADEGELLHIAIQWLNHELFGD